MNPFVRKLVTEWRRLEMPFAGETIVIGVSGGADSVSLLLGINELKLAEKLDLRIVAAHFNHGLRDGESRADEQFVRDLTTELKIEFAVGHWSPAEGGNLEQNARNARYEFLDRTAEGLEAYAVLTGHTVNDQAETFLMNLIRGSGPHGLCGMKPVRAMHRQAPKPVDGCDEQEADAAGGEPLLFSMSRLLVRPLLTWAKRADTEGYCRQLNIEYRYDTMNEDTAFRRVRIRKVLLPLLQDFNPRIIETLANTAALMQSILPDGNQSAESDELKLSDLTALAGPQLNDLIRSWLAARRGTTRQLNTKHIAAVERLVLSMKSGRTAELPGGRVTKVNGKLVYEENRVEN